MAIRDLPLGTRALVLFSSLTLHLLCAKDRSTWFAGDRKSRCQCVISRSQRECTVDASRTCPNPKHHLPRCSSAPCLWPEPKLPQTPTTVWCGKCKVTTTGTRKTTTWAFSTGSECSEPSRATTSTTTTWAHVSSLPAHCAGRFKLGGRI